MGLPNGIAELAELNLSYNLAVSLHAPNDKLRNMIVPANRNIGIEKMLNAADHYFSVTRQESYLRIRVTGRNK